MKRCNFCSRYAVGQPLYCPTCGRTYNVKICARGHINPRTTQFCPTCGSSEFSTPAPPEALAAGAVRRVLQVILIGAVGLAAAAVFIQVLLQFAEPLLSLVLTLAIIYWLVTLLPGPVKRTGRAAGKQVVRLVRGRTQRR